jgi:Tfp pilus assembly protein PilF
MPSRISSAPRRAPWAAADPNVNYTLAGLYLRSGQPEKATQAMGRVLSQNPGSGRARLRMAQAQAQSKGPSGRHHDARGDRRR